MTIEVHFSLFEVTAYNNDEEIARAAIKATHLRGKVYYMLTKTATGWSVRIGVGTHFIITG